MSRFEGHENTVLHLAIVPFLLLTPRTHRASFGVCVFVCVFLCIFLVPVSYIMVRSEKLQHF